MNNNINNLANSVAKLSDSDYSAFWDNLLKRRISAPTKSQVSSGTVNKYVATLKDLAQEQSFSSEAAISFKIKITETSCFDTDQVMVDAIQVEITNLETDLVLDNNSKKQLQETLTYTLEDHYGGATGNSVIGTSKVQKYLETTNEKIQKVLNEIYSLEDTTGEEILEAVMEKLSNRKARLRSALGVKKRH